MINFTLTSSPKVSDFKKYNFSNSIWIKREIKKVR